MTKRTPKTTKPEPTAAETFAARRNDIARLMDVLQMELDKHAEGAKADPRNWGFAGSLGKVPIDWPTIDPLLGTMTDAALSKRTGVPELTILRRRKRLGVRSFAHQRIIDAAKDPETTTPHPRTIR